MKQPITVIHHSADFDGIFSREVAKHFLGTEGVTYIGWDYGDPLIDMPAEGLVYVIDLNPECIVADVSMKPAPLSRIIWIDHHKTAIDKLPADIPGYRIDGVAACRLAWQWFSLYANWDPREQQPPYELPNKTAYIDRQVMEPTAVMLAGEYDVWDKRNPDAETFQFGLRSEKTLDWERLLTEEAGVYTKWLIQRGTLLQDYQQQRDANIVKHRSFKVKFEGLTFLALNTAMGNSLTFKALDVPETGHDALMKMCYTGKHWEFSLYHARHNTGLDLSEIAKTVIYKGQRGGGHRGACGFQCSEWALLETGELVLSV